MRIHAYVCLAVLTAGLCFPLPAQAEPDNKKSGDNDVLEGLRQATRHSPLFWDVQTVIDEYVRVMAKHYDLSDTQLEYTRQLMNTRVKQFLKDYEKDVRILMGEYQEYRMRGEMPTPAAAKDFARRAAPLLAVIRTEIMDGNMQWRRILNDEQRKKHDRDLEIMRRQFDYYEKSMERWAEGDVRPSDVGIRSRNIPGNIVRVEDSMGYYVRNFIASYNLDEGQRQTAYSILREAREEARRYRDSHKAEFAELEARQKELMASNPRDEDDQKRIKEEGKKLTERRLELERPLNKDLFDRFKERLETIPTADQKAAYEARQNALKERLARLRRPAPGTATLPAGTAETQPASEQQAAAAAE